MNALVAQLTYRLKAVLAAAALAAVAATEAAVTDPSTAAAIEKVVPAPYTQLVPILLGIIGVVLVHHFPNAAKPASSSDRAPKTELPDTLPTTAVPTITSSANR